VEVAPCNVYVAVDSLLRAQQACSTDAVQPFDSGRCATKPRSSDDRSKAFLRPCLRLRRRLQKKRLASCSWVCSQPYATQLAQNHKSDCGKGTLHCCRELPAGFARLQYDYTISKLSCSAKGYYTFDTFYYDVVCGSDLASYLPIARVSAVIHYKTSAGEITAGGIGSSDPDGPFTALST
jgi:hypothetical protein